MADCRVSGLAHRMVGRRPFIDRTCQAISAVSLVDEFSGRVYYVDPNTGNDANEGTEPGSPMLTVQAAVDRCTDHNGDVVAVMQTGAWQYDSGLVKPLFVDEEVTLNKAGMTLAGITPGGTGVLWTPASDGGTCIHVTAIDCLIEGFLFDEGTHAGCRAIYVEWDDADAWGENLEVRHCVFSDTVDIGIEMEYSWYNWIHDNVFWECDTYGIFSDAAGSGFAYARIHDNVFHDCGIAMALLGGADDNQIFRNTIYNGNAQGAAAAANEGINTTGGTRNQVFDNWFSCLLPVPANGDWDNLNTAAATDAWVGNHCMNGLAVTNPA
jgi:hypothetical protein